VVLKEIGNYALMPDYIAKHLLRLLNKPERDYLVKVATKSVVQRSEAQHSRGPWFVLVGLRNEREKLVEKDVAGGIFCGTFTGRE
jgi:hypothetical protein